MADLTADLTINRASGAGDTTVYIAPATGTATQTDLTAAPSNLNVTGDTDLTIRDAHVIVTNLTRNTAGTGNANSNLTISDSTVEIHQSGGAPKFDGIWDIQRVTFVQGTGTVTAFTFGAYGPGDNERNGWNAGGAGIHTPSTFRDVNFWGRGGTERMQISINAFPPGTIFENVSFTNPDGTLGCFAELAPINVTNGTFGEFVRDRNNYGGQGGGEGIIRITGGPDRNNLSVTDNWILYSNNTFNLENITTDINVDADGNQSVWHFDMNLPEITSGTFAGGGILRLGASAGNSGTAQSRQRNLRGWNPRINDGVAGPKIVWTGFQLFEMPATFANDDPPTEITGSHTFTGTENGFGILQDDTGLISSPQLTTSIPVTAYTDRTFRLFDFATQVNTFDGTTLTENFGREMTITAADRGIPMADLTWTNTHEIIEPEDTFLNGRDASYAPTDVTDGRDIYPALKAAAYRNERNQANNRLPVVPTADGIRYFNNVGFNHNAAGVDVTGVLQIPLGPDADFMNQTHDFRDAAGSDVEVDWFSTDTIRNITISGGNHINFPDDVIQGTFTNDPTIEFGFAEFDLRGWTGTTGRFTPARLSTTTIGTPVLLVTTAQASEFFGLDLPEQATNNDDRTTFTNVIIRVPAATAHTLTFTNIPHANGGWFTVFRNTGTSDSPTWTELAGVTHRVGPGATANVTVLSTDTGAASQYLMLWRPEAFNHYTTRQFVDYSGANFPSVDTTATAQLIEIPSVILADRTDADNQIPANTVTWSTANIAAAQGGDGNSELIGTLVGTDGDDRLSNTQTQVMMMSAFEDVNYFNVYVSFINSLTQDYILPVSIVETQADGEYVQLDTGDGTQQQVTSITNVDLDGNTMTATLQATISGTNAGGTISFPAVQIYQNPDGISAEQVRDALSAMFSTTNTHTTTEVDRVIADLGAHDDAITSQTVHGRINLVSANVNQVDRVVDNIDVNLVEVNDNVIVASVKPAAVQTAQDGADPIMRIPPTI